MQPACSRHVAERCHAIGEEHERDRRGQREADPGGGRSRIAGARQAKRHADLARSRTGEKLAERDEIGVSRLAEPAPAHHELLAEVAQMRDWAAEGGQAELEKGEKISPAVPRVAAGAAASLCSVISSSLEPLTANQAGGGLIIRPPWPWPSARRKMTNCAIAIIHSRKPSSTSFRSGSLRFQACPCRWSTRRRSRSVAP